MKSQTIVIIHGIFMNPVAWSHWVEYFERKGFMCLSPGFPYHEGQPHYLRQKMDKRLAEIRFSHLVDHYTKFIDKLPEKPILIGHSMGGLLVQKLLQMGKGIAGVCIQPAPPPGIIGFDPKFFSVHWPVINPLKGNSLCLPSYEWFHKAVCNHTTIEEASRIYDELVVPESRRIPRTAFADGLINFLNPHPPLLFISGDRDASCPAKFVKRNYLAYADKRSIKEYKEYEGKTHYIYRQPGWEKVIGDVFGWIQKVNSEARVRATAV